MNTINRKHHSLKTDPIPFGETMQGRKLWEIRLNDRDFCEGDTVTLHETASSGREMAEGAPLEYTGRTWHGAITWAMHGPQYGLAEGWCVFGVVPSFADKAEDIEARLQYELENSCPHCGGSGHKDDCATDAEPVAWAVKHANWQLITAGTDKNAELEWAENYEGATVIPLYTHPPAESQGVPFTASEVETLKTVLNKHGDRAHMIGAQNTGYLIDRLSDWLCSYQASSELSTSPGNGWSVKSGHGVWEVTSPKGKPISVPVELEEFFSATFGG